VFLAYNVAPSKWTLIGGSLLFCVLAAHESMPLVYKSREVYRTFSKRFSSKIGDDDDDKEAQKMLAETLIDKATKKQDRRCDL
jgi:hypothetical protein